MNSQLLSCKEARQIDLVQYLAELGHQPKRVSGNNYMYLSPLRKESTPSFKVDRKNNIWFDHGDGRGGNFVDFGILYHNCGVRELLQILGNRLVSPQVVSPVEKTPSAALSPIRIRSVKSIESLSLVTYLADRQIPLWLAQNHCKQVEFDLYGNTITALGFANRAGGYELRNSTFKGSTHPKDITTINNSSNKVAVFEGFFSFLSYLKVTDQSSSPTNFLVLNSLAFLEKVRPVLEDNARIELFLDNDFAGKQVTSKALKWGPKYEDRSYEYRPYKDWNDRLLGVLPPPRQTPGQRRHR